MKFLLRYLKPYYGIMSVGLAIKMFGTLIELALPYILSYILNTVIEDGGSVTMIIVWGLCMIACAAIALLCNVKANRMAAKVARDSSERIRHDLFERTMTLSGRQTDYFTIPSLESRITTDTYNVHHFIGMIQRMGVRAPMLLLGGIVITVIMDPALSLVMLATLPIIFTAVYFVSSRGVPLYKKVQSSVDGMIRVVREDAQGIRVIKALSKTEHEHERYDRVNRALVRDEKRAGLTMGVVNPIMNLLMNLGISFVVLLGAYRVFGRTSEAGNIVAFTQYFTMISMAMMSITRIFTMFTKSSASANRIQEVVDAERDLVTASADNYPDRPNDDGYIVFDNVSFSYNRAKDNLKSISFSVPRGGALGIIGSTGSGKTTIVNLLMRFYDVGDGSVRIGGRDVRTIPEDELHTMFGVALQNDFLYNDTVEENIKFGRDLTHEQVVSAAKTAQADSFISNFADGYEHILSQKGTNVSGGQKQRILIARAVAGSPDILILDDSSSALDYKTDAELRRAIAEDMKDTTTVVVAQRISSVMSSDVIIVLEDGELIGVGDHAHLMETCEVYREIAGSQMGGAFLE